MNEKCKNAKPRILILTVTSQQNYVTTFITSWLGIITLIHESLTLAYLITSF